MLFILRGHIACPLFYEKSQNLFLKNILNIK